MIRRNTIVLMALCAAVAAGAYAVTIASRSASQPMTGAATRPAADEALMDWLGIPADQRDQLRSHDPGFTADYAAMRADLTAKRAALAAALENPDSSDATVRAGVEGVIGANDGLQRRLSDYLLSVRHHLTADQQRKLFGVCAEGIRQGRGGQWRHGQGGGKGWGGGKGAN